LFAPTAEEGVGSDEQGVGSIARKTGKGPIDLVDRRGVENLDLQPDGGGSFLHLVQCGLGRRRIARIDEHSNANSLGYQVTQQPQPFSDHLLGEKIHAGRVAARPIQAGDKAKLDGVFADADRDRRRCSFGCKRSDVAAGRSDHGHTAAHQIGRQRRQVIVLAI
jgi:hypothetical protein